MSNEQQAPVSSTSRDDCPLCGRDHFYTLNSMFPCSKKNNRESQLCGVNFFLDRQIAALFVE